MALDFTTGVLDPRVTFTRASTATFVGSNGIIQTAAINAPRFDYNPSTLAPLGLLIEEARTNLLTYSDQFDNVAWVKSGLNTTGTPAYIDVAVSPDGTQNADFMIEDTANSQHTTRVSATLLATTTHTYSFFVKAAGRINISVSRFNSAVVPSFVHTFTLTGSGSSSGGTVIALSNGWYRCSGSFTTTGAGVGGFVILLSDGTGTTYLGNGTSGVYIWGAQLEAGAFATSYIPTVASQVTRNADVVSMTGTNFSDWYNASAGTFFFRGSTQLGATRHFLNGPTTNDRFLSSSAAGSTGISDLTNSAVGGIITANTTFNATVSYGASGLAASLNGGASGTSAYSGVFASVNQLQIGRRGGLYMVGHIQKLNYYPQELTLSEMSAFSK
jgi:hypothetical protein